MMSACLPAFIVNEMGPEDGDKAAREEDEPAEEDDILMAVVGQPLAQHAPAHTERRPNYNLWQELHAAKDL